MVTGPQDHSLPLSKMEALPVSPSPLEKRLQKTLELTWWHPQDWFVVVQLLSPV